MLGIMMVVSEVLLHHQIMIESSQALDIGKVTSKAKKIEDFFFFCPAAAGRAAQASINSKKEKGTAMARSG